MDNAVDPMPFSRRLTLFRKQWQRNIHRTLIGGTVALTVCKIAGLPLPDSLNWSVIALMLGYVLMDLAENTYTDCKVSVYKDHDASNRSLEQWLENHRYVQEAVIVACTPHFLYESMISKLLKRGIKVTLYVQTLAAVRKIGMARQEELLIEELDDLYTNNDDELEKTLLVRFYNALPTLHAIRFDDTVLVCGNYVVEHAFDPHTAPTDEIRRRIEQRRFFPMARTQDTMKLWGHIKPRVMVYKNTVEYDVLNGMLNEQLENFEIFNAYYEGSKELQEMTPEAISAAKKRLAQYEQKAVPSSTSAPASCEITPVHVSPSMMGRRDGEQQKPGDQVA